MTTSPRYDTPYVQSAVSPDFLLPLLGLAFVAALLWFWARREKSPAMVAGDGKPQAAE